MFDTSQLQLALREVSEGAVALLHAGRASDAAPTVGVSANFTYQAITAPLTRLSLLLGAEPPRPRARRPRKSRRARTVVVQVLAPGQLPAPPQLDGFDLESAWDPDERPYSPDADPQFESGNCRALLLEIVRRAAFDWVLYRTSSKLPNRMLADNAYTWLFVEEPDTGAWRQRELADKELTGFVSICEAVGVDPDRMRDRIRTLTERDIMGAGRPAEKRRYKPSSDEVMHSDDLRVFDVDVGSIATFDPLYSMEG